MPRSMTAFARCTSEFDWGAVTCELRSINHRYFEVGLRLPDSLRDMEMSLRDKARQKLARGKIDISVQLAFNQNEQSFDLDMQRAISFVEMAEQAGQLLSNPAAVSPLDIIRWPGVLRQSEINPDILKASVLLVFEATVQQLLDARQREGGKLREVIEERLTAVKGIVSEVRGHLPEILRSQRQRLVEKLAELRKELDPERLEQEMLLIINRADVDEEMDRLETHIVEVRRTLQSSESIGRRLDFLMQEMNREANTLGAKSIASSSTLASVELKVLIEQIREQVQNIE